MSFGFDVFWGSPFFGRKAFLPAASFATRLLFLTGKTSGFPRNAPFPCPAPGARQRSCHAPGWPRFFRRGLLAAPGIIGGLLVCAAVMGWGGLKAGWHLRSAPRVRYAPAPGFLLGPGFSRSLSFFPAVKNGALGGPADPFGVPLARSANTSRTRPRATITRVKAMFRPGLAFMGWVGNQNAFVFPLRDCASLSVFLRTFFSGAEPLGETW